jgi:hypothetical protein
MRLFEGSDSICDYIDHRSWRYVTDDLRIDRR